MNIMKRGALSPILVAIGFAATASLAVAQDRLPWQSSGGNDRVAQSSGATGDPSNDPYGNRPPARDRFEDGAGNADSGAYDSGRDVYVPPAEEEDSTYRSDDSFRADEGRRAPSSGYGYGEPYRPPASGGAEPYDRDYGGRPAGPSGAPRNGGGYEQGEIIRAGHGFFGSISKGLASAVEYVFQKQGRPNGYILGEDAGGAFIVGLRYGEGILYTKDAGDHKVYWQGPSLGYDAGAEGSKTMVLVYNLSDVSELYQRFGGVQGSLYVIGGVGVQFQKYGNVTLALIRSGVGLRMGANVGYLKYTRSPTWNPL